MPNSTAIAPDIIETKRSGKLLFFSGLTTSILAFCMVAARKSNGQTDYQWLGTDDFCVMGLLCLAGMALSTAGGTQWLAADRAQDHSVPARQSVYQKQVAAATERCLAAATDAQKTMHPANLWKLTASTLFTVLALYALLCGTLGSPVPESKLGPHQDAQLASYVGFYGAMGMVSGYFSYRKVSSIYHSSSLPRR